MPFRVNNQSLRSQQSLKCDGVLVFKYLQAESSYLHFFIGKRYGNAIKRNLLKRRIRHLFKLFSQQLSPSMLCLSVFPIKKNISYEELRACFALLTKKMV